jgi:hypothetical protein
LVPDDCRLTDSIEAVRSSVDKALAQLQTFSAVSGEIVALRIELLS